MPKPTTSTRRRRRRGARHRNNQYRRHQRYVARRVARRVVRLAAAAARASARRIANRREVTRKLEDLRKAYGGGLYPMIQPYDTEGTKTQFIPHRKAARKHYRRTNHGIIPTPATPRMSAKAPKAPALKTAMAAAGQRAAAMAPAAPTPGPRQWARPAAAPPPLGNAGGTSNQHQQTRTRPASNTTTPTPRPRSTALRTPGSAFHALMATYAVIAFNPDDHMTAESRVAAMRRTGQALSALGRYHAEMSKEIYGNLPPRLAADIGGKPEELLTEAGRVMEQLTTAYEAHVEDARREMNRLYGPDVVQAAAANGAGRR